MEILRENAVTTLWIECDWNTWNLHPDDSPYTKSISVSIVLRGRKGMVEWSSGSGGILEGKGAQWHFSADKTSGRLQLRERDVLMLKQQQWEKYSPQMNSL